MKPSPSIQEYVNGIAEALGGEVAAILQRLHEAEEEAAARIAAAGPPVEYDYAGAAEYLKISRRTLELRVAARAISFRRDGKRIFFTRSALDTYRAGGTVQPRPRRVITL